MRPVYFSLWLAATLSIGWWLMQLDSQRSRSRQESAERSQDVRLSDGQPAKSGETAVSFDEPANLFGELTPAQPFARSTSRSVTRTADNGVTGRPRLSSRQAGKPPTPDPVVPQPVETAGDDWPPPRNPQSSAPKSAENSQAPRSSSSAFSESSAGNLESLAGSWKISYQSTEGRPIHTRKMGSGPAKLLVLAGIEGTDRVAVRWIDAIADQLEEQPDLLQRGQYLLVRAVNPDGLTMKKAENAHGVELNRNFPAKNWAPAANQKTGPRAASEVETRAVLQLVKSFKPDRVLVLRSSPKHTLVIQSRQASEWTAQLPDSLRLQARKLDGSRSAGSIETFVEEQLAIPVLSLILPVGEDWRKSWPLHQTSLLTAVSGKPFSLPPHTAKKDWVPFGTLDDSLQQVRAEDSPNVTKFPAHRPRRRGYEELPPPPKNR